MPSKATTRLERELQYLDRETMKQRHSNGQLRPLDRPLEDRMTTAQLAARQEKREYRQHISLEHAKTRGLAMVALSVLQRGFFGRLKWLLFGR